MEDLIGRKVRGFKFENGKYNGLIYGDVMGKYIGEIGVISTYHDGTGNFGVCFKDDYFYYPGQLIKEHLVDEWIIGQEYEFTDHGCKWVKRKLLAVLPENYDYRYIAGSEISENAWTSYDQIRPIENNEVHQKIAILEKELAELKQLVK